MNTKHIHQFKIGRSKKIKVCVCGKFQHLISNDNPAIVEQTKHPLFEDVISHTQDKYGGISTINAAGRALSDFVAYVNTFYSDNGNTVSLIMDSVRKEKEGPKNV